ncbi:LacI family DNA-binding transcriptional regulator [Amnibacterium setariae]|uniref:LacI family DNA-binding transcriptional regulator n=1 Tax=Amnibacterium setariae TaxID=2306585 RepID=UPI001314E4FD|nr:LacI family DNA-binding transcriptional regulator [Amnibacterium setariae]
MGPEDEGSPSPGVVGAGEAVRRPPTLKHVAQHAGVSYQTVSRVLNGDPRVTATTRSKVEAAVKALDYHPSAAARDLVRGYTTTFGVVAEDPHQFGTASTVRGIDAAAALNGWTTTAATLRLGAVADVDEAMAALQRRGARAIALIGVTEGVARRVFEVPRAVPLIAASQGAVDLDRRAVAVDQDAGVRAAIEHLVARGRRRIAHVAGPAASLDALRRLRAYRREVEARGLPAIVLQGDWTAEAGHRAGLALASRGDVDAVFCANDQTAIGVLSALHSSGVAVPERVAVVGFDDVPEAGYLIPPLTTVAQDFAALGAAVLQAMRDAAETGREPRTDRLLTPELIVRATS